MFGRPGRGRVVLVSVWLVGYITFSSSSSASAPLSVACGTRGGLSVRDVVVAGGSVRLAGQIPASTLLKCCKLRIVLVHRVIGLPGCWVAVMSIIFLCG